LFLIKARKMARSRRKSSGRSMTGRNGGGGSLTSTVHWFEDLIIFGRGPDGSGPPRNAKLSRQRSPRAPEIRHRLARTVCVSELVLQDYAWLFSWE
jgi:hypothetical protein